MTLRGDLLDRTRRLSSESHWHCDCHGPGSSLPVSELPEPVPEPLQIMVSLITKIPSHARAGYGFLANGQTAGDSASLPRLRVAREPWLLAGIDSRPPDVWATLATSESDSRVSIWWGLWLRGHTVTVTPIGHGQSITSDARNPGII